MIAVGELRQIKMTLPFEHFWKPRVIAPVDLHHDSVLGSSSAQELVDGI